MANRLDFDKLKALITKEEYTVLGRQMMCQLTIYNGHHEAGVAGVADMQNFDEELGKAAAHKKAMDALANLGAFFIRERMYTQESLIAANADMTQGPLTRFVGYVSPNHYQFLREKFGLHIAPFPDVSR